jgi:hypothetical protein
LEGGVVDVGCRHGAWMNQRVLWTLAWMLVLARWGLDDTRVKQRSSGARENVSDLLSDFCISMRFLSV